MSFQSLLSRIHYIPRRSLDLFDEDAKANIYYFRCFYTLFLQNNYINTQREKHETWIALKSKEQTSICSNSKSHRSARPSRAGKQVVQLLSHRQLDTATCFDLGKSPRLTRHAFETSNGTAVWIYIGQTQRSDNFWRWIRFKPSIQSVDSRKLSVKYQYFFSIRVRTCGTGICWFSRYFWYQLTFVQ